MLHGDVVGVMYVIIIYDLENVYISIYIDAVDTCLEWVKRNLGII